MQTTLPKPIVSGHGIDISRLADAMARSRKVLQKFRQERVAAVKMICGSHWSENSALKRQPINVLNLYKQIVSRSLISKEPRVLLSTFDRAAGPTVKAVERWLNQEIKRMDLATTLKRVVIDALFSIGICKVGLATPADAARAGWLFHAGRPFVDRVDLDDFVFDPHARDFREASFIGHRVRVPFEAVRDGKIYSKARLALSPKRDDVYNMQGDERISALQRFPYAAEDDEFMDWIDLWEIYVPSKKMVVVLADDWIGPVEGEYASEPLAVQNWIGPPKGPYHILGFETIPGNAMPKGPIQDLIDLHRAINNFYRKIIDTGWNLKSLLFYSDPSGEAADRIAKASHLEPVNVHDAKGVQQVTLGEPNQVLMAATVELIQKFSWAAGNLDMLGGLSPQSKTLGQDEMLAQSASGTIQDKQEDTVRLASDVCEALFWYEWHHPIQVMRSKFTIPGVPDIWATQQITPDHRQQIPWDQLEFRVDPYSLRHQTPQQRLQAMQQVFQTFVFPTMQAWQASGVTLDWNAMFTQIGQWMDMPQFADWLTIQDPVMPQSQGDGGGQPQMPGQTTTHERVNRPGQTSQGNATTMMQMLLGKGAQGSQLAKLGMAPQ